MPGAARSFCVTIPIRRLMISKLSAIPAYWRATHPAASRDVLLAQQSARLDQWLQTKVPRVPAYAGFQGRLCDLPLTDKATIMARFDHYNTATITADAGWAAFEDTKRIGNFTVGASTGTSGNRGLFVISDHERFRWLGTILGKTVPGFWRTQHRVAVILPLNTPLYDSANKLGVLSLQFFDINAGPEAWVDELRVFDPTIIIAPPKILTWLAHAGKALRPRKVFSAAETCDPQDKAIIECRFPAPMGEIFMATEGLFAVSCAEGSLHLCEDTMHFELPQVGSDPDVRALIVSDFSRNTQIMARYQMNDLVRLGHACACGSPLLTVAEVIGRKDDCFYIGPDKTMFTPDVLRNAIIDADRGISDFRLRQIAANKVVLMLPIGTGTETIQQAKLGLTDIFAKRGLQPEISHEIKDLSQITSVKRRRIENRAV